MRATIIAGVALLAVPCGNSAADAPCGRACLNGFVDQHPAALVAHDPSRLPLTKTARYAENGQTRKLGDGMWGPVIAMGRDNLYFADPKAGQPSPQDFDKNCKRVVRFDHRNKTTVWNGGSIDPVNTPFDEPFAFEIGELFKITNGKIQQIEAGAECPLRYARVGVSRKVGV